MTTRGRRKAGPSIEDVARLAGVSAQTVSRVSTGAERVRPGTRDKVLAAMDQLGYSPNHAARALRSGAFGTIGLISHRFERTGETLTSSAVIAAAEARDYAVTIVNARNHRADDPGADSWDTATTRLSNLAIDGLIVIRNEGTPEQLRLPARLPVAVSDSRLVAFYPAVSTDHMQGSTLATEHLLRLGHRTVHHLAGPLDSDPAIIRESAWRRTLENAGIRPPEAFRGDWTAASGYEIGRRIADDPSVTALYSANDEMAIGVVRAMHEAGRRVPEDLSVVGFDDIALSDFLYPPLTTIRQDFARIGEELVRLVVDQIQTKAPPASSRVQVPSELIIRATTAPPR